MRLCLIDFAAVFRSLIFSFAETKCIKAFYYNESVDNKNFESKFMQEDRKRVMNFLKHDHQVRTNLIFQQLWEGNEKCFGSI